MTQASANPNDMLFLQLVLQFAQLGMIHLGKQMDPVSKEAKVDLAGAKYMIDTLVMLRDKTKGNLQKEEEEFLSGTISNLQMNYVEEVGNAASPEQKETTAAPASEEPQA